MKKALSPLPWRKELKPYSNRLMAALRGESAPGLDGLIYAWSESPRVYHTTQHLLECLNLFDRWTQGEWDKADSELLPVAVAIWFHDFVYDPGRSDNEERSVEAAMFFVDELVSPSDRAKFSSQVRRLILATCHEAKPQTADERLIVDIDLAILGAPEERYEEYRAQVRAEYAAVSDDLFRAGRLAIVQQFLARGDQLFHTEKGRKEFGARALENLSREARELSAEVQLVVDRNRERGG